MPESFDGSVVDKILISSIRSDSGSKFTDSTEDSHLPAVLRANMPIGHCTRG